jgi:hypothetical protein
MLGVPTVADRVAQTVVKRLLEPIIDPVFHDVRQLSSSIEVGGDGQIGFKRSRELTWDQNEDYLYAKTDQSNYRDPDKGRKEGLKQFLDDKSIKPGLESYKRA